MSYKTKAYRRTDSGYEPVTKKFICSLNKEDQRIFIDTNKPFYLTPEDDGLHLTFNTRQKTFRFYPKFEHRYFGSNEESATHKYCIEEITKLKELNIKIKGKKELIKFKFNYSFPELVLPIGEYYVKPDLLLYIREPFDLALKWNRVIAVEIVVSHDLNGEKLQLYKNYKIPVLRIKANKKWGRKKEEDMSDSKKTELREWITNTFKKGYTADLLLDSKSKSYLESKTIQKLELDIENLKSKNESLNKDFRKIGKIALDLKNENKNLNKKVENYDDNNRVKSTLIKEKDDEVIRLKQSLKKQTESKMKFRSRLIYALILLLLIVVIQILIL